MFKNIARKPEVLIILTIFVVAFFLLTWNLGNQSLSPWDEAWYASIARNIVRNGNPIFLKYNGNPFSDHPPLGFWSIALSYKLFGINEFSTRLPMAFFGSLSIVVVFLIGKKIKNLFVGLSAAMILFSSRWFLMRARTGNLDIILLLCESLTFYFAVQPLSWKQIYLLWFFFALSLISKTTIAILLLPMVLFSTIRFIKSQSTNKFPVRNFVISLLIFIIPVAIWYLPNTLVYGESFLKHNIYEVGMRRREINPMSTSLIKGNLLYLHSAVHRWYLPFIISVFGSIFLLRKSIIPFLYFYLFTTLFPFLISNKTEVWHLIPAIVPLALLISYFSFEAKNQALKIVKRFSLRNFTNLDWIMLSLFGAVAIISLKDHWVYNFTLPRSTSNEAHVSIAAKGSALPLYVADTTYIPAIIFYADINIKEIYQPAMFDISIQRPYQLITRWYLLDKKYRYTVIKRAGDYVLVRVE